MKCTKQIAIVVSLLIGAIHADSYALHLHLGKNKDIIHNYCTEVFIKNDTSQLKKLIRIVGRTNRSVRNTLYVSIITWALKNNYEHCDLFIQKLSNTTLSRPYLKYPSLGVYLLFYAMEHHHNDIVQLLIPRIPIHVLTQSDLVGKTCADYALIFNNPEAQGLIQEYIRSQASSIFIKKIISRALFIGQIVVWSWAFDIVMFFPIIL